MAVSSNALEGASNRSKRVLLPQTKDALNSPNKPPNNIPMVSRPAYFFMYGHPNKNVRRMFSIWRIANYSL
tara:strand:+ start:78 stop:290 length:213 start_codon:yes stop_codon:yes gene_type:complete